MLPQDRAELFVGVETTELHRKFPCYSMELVAVRLPLCHLHTVE